EKMTIEEINRFRQSAPITPGHPEHGHTAGAETTTGPLGQGLTNAVGMAIAERHLAAIFGADLVDHATYVLASDGDLMEGVSQEAIALAGPMARRGRTQPTGAARLGAALGYVRSRPSRRISSPAARRSHRAARSSGHEREADTCAGAERYRDARGFRTGPRRAHRGAAGNDRRLRGPHRIQ